MIGCVLVDVPEVDVQISSFKLIYTRAILLRQTSCADGLPHQHYSVPPSLLQ